MSVFCESSFNRSGFWLPSEWRVCFIDDSDHFLNDSRLLFCQVSLLERVICKIIDFKRRHASALFGLAVGFPIPFANRLGKDGLVVTFAELEVEKVVLLLFISSQKRKERDAIDVLGDWLFGKLGHGGEDIPEGADMVGGVAGVNDGRPTGEHRSANAALVHISFHATK